MNQERIAELTKQAYSKAQFNAEMKSKDFDRPEALDIWNEFPEVFAELIVQECIALCEQVVDGGCGSAEDCVEELKEHFEIGFHFDNEDE
jgi:hypothetical protein